MQLTNQIAKVQNYHPHLASYCSHGTHRPEDRGRSIVETEEGGMGEVEHGIVLRRPGTGNVGGGRGQVPVYLKQFLCILGQTLTVCTNHPELLHLTQNNSGPLRRVLKGERNILPHPLPTFTRQYIQVTFINDFLDAHPCSGCTFL